MARTQGTTTSVDVQVVSRLEGITERLGADLLFLSPRGSRLYGLSNEHSDFDYFAVITKTKTKKNRYAKQIIEDDYDIVLMDLGTFTEYAASGVPENLEAMFSRQAEVDKIEDFRNGFHVGTDQVLEKYLRTIKSFAFNEAEGTKHRRHALRLALNLRSIIRTGRFNPTLSRIEAELITSLAKLPRDRVYDDALAIAWA